MQVRCVLAVFTSDQYCSNFTAIFAAINYVALHVPSAWDIWPAAAKSLHYASDMFLPVQAWMLKR